jgi:hypothetical protein
MILFLAALNPVGQQIDTLTPFVQANRFAALAGLSITAAGLCLACAMPTRIGRRFA